MSGFDELQPALGTGQSSFGCCRRRKLATPVSRNSWCHLEKGELALLPYGALETLSVGPRAHLHRCQQDWSVGNALFEQKELRELSDQTLNDLGAQVGDIGRA